MEQKETESDTEIDGKRERVLCLLSGIARKVPVISDIPLDLNVPLYNEMYLIQYSLVQFD